MLKHRPGGHVEPMAGLPRMATGAISYNLGIPRTGLVGEGGRLGSGFAGDGHAAVKRNTWDCSSLDAGFIGTEAS